MVQTAVDFILLVGCVYYLTLLLYVPNPTQDYAQNEIPLRSWKTFHFYRQYQNTQHQLSWFDFLRFPLYLKTITIEKNNLIFETRLSSPMYCFFCTSFWVSCVVCLVTGHFNGLFIFGCAGLVNVVFRWLDFDK